jgi:predicted TIM-barrel fold metal-dependent hydrolase
MNSAPTSDVSLLTRRDALQLGAAGLTALAMGQAAPAAEKETGQKEADLKKGYIDAHVHVWTPDTKRYPLAEGFTVKDMEPPSFTPEELLKLARPVGVTRVVLIQMSFYGYDNSYMLDTMKRFKGVFSGVAVIDEEKRPAETMRELKKQGVRGFRIRPGKRSPETWLDGPGMAAMWKCGAEEKLSMCHLIDANSLPAVDRMCRKFPDTPVVIDHFARIGVDGVIRGDDLKRLADLSRHKHVAVKVSAFYALGAKKAPYYDLSPMIRRLLDAYGPQRLMWATDCPYQVQGDHTYAGSIELIRNRLDYLSATDRNWLLRGTAERVFFS